MNLLAINLLCLPNLKKVPSIFILIALLLFQFGTLPRLAYSLKNDSEEVVILLNADPEKEVTFMLPEGRWLVLADHLNASGKQGAGGIRSGRTVLPPTAGALLALDVDSGRA